MYADEQSNRQPFANVASTPVHGAHCQRLVDDAIKASQDFGDLMSLDAHLENIRIYDANVLEAEHRSLRDMQYERGGYNDLPGGEPALHPEAYACGFIDDGIDDDDDPQPSPKRSRPPPPPPPFGGVPNSGIGPFVPEQTQPGFDIADEETFIDDGDDEDDPPTFVNNGGFGPELSPVVIPPDDVVPDASAADVAPEDVPTPTAPVPTPTPSVIHICDTPGCRRRPESDPCGLQYKSLSTFDATCACFLTDGNARLPATPST